MYEKKNGGVVTPVFQAAEYTDAMTTMLQIRLNRRIERNIIDQLNQNGKIKMLFSR